MVLQIMAEKISNYKFDDINVGQRKKFSVSITETMVNEFAKITGICKCYWAISCILQRA